MPSENRNSLIFLVVAMLLLLAYNQFVLSPMEKHRQAEAAQAKAVAAAQHPAAQGQAFAPSGEPIVHTLTRVQAQAATPRIAVRNADLSGTVSLTGARLDDLYLTAYHQTTQANSPPVELLRPYGADNAYYAVAGWVGAPAGMPDENTPWTAASTEPLTPQHPLELTYAAPSGLVFHREIKLDDQYLFTITDTVENRSAAPVNIAPYGAVQRRGVPPDLGHQYMEGAIGMFDRVLQEVKYPDWKKKGTKDYAATGGWTGVTDKYWMTVFAPPQNEQIKARYQVTPVGGVDDYEVSYVGAPRLIQPGASATEVTHLFAGAKVVETLRQYSAKLGVFKFDKAVDWGIFEIVTQPIFTVLDFYANFLRSHFGLTFGWAILALTITIRVLMFPAFNASYAMSTKMKKVQPEMKGLQERLKGDPPALQKAMMALYAREKINPVTGCIPMLLPLPVFYALSNLFSVTIEMRQATFGWVKDLSAPDPTTIWNLFGLLPWDPNSTGIIVALEHAPYLGGVVNLVFHLGAWPIIYAAMMWFSLMTGPTMTGIDPTQQKLMRWMPWVFMIVLAQSAVGLVIYWAFSSVFTMAQQYVLMRRFKVDNPIDAFIARITHPKADVKAAE
ncbi:MAG TPA: membrane protein insertase YidC [Caulobacteraceae bacterium]|jgi:YidC/Oxa1 family membrane protein insertase